MMKDSEHGPVNVTEFSAECVATVIDFDLATSGYRRFLRQLDTLAELQREAYTDSLTGFMNRRGLARALQSGREYLYVAADLNGFKRAQDRHPDHHAYGDRLLDEFATFLRNNTRHADWILCRPGGDEFLVVVDSTAAMGRVLGLIRQWRSIDGAITASAGYGTTAEAADRRCMDYKRTRKGWRGLLRRLLGRT